MAPQAEAGFPATLSTWVKEIVRSPPEPARATLAELLIGAMLGGGGHVTRAILAPTPRLGWQACPWMPERGRFRLLGLVAALCGVVRRETPGPRPPRRGPLRRPAARGAVRDRPVPCRRPCRQDRPGQGPAAGGGRPPRAAVP